MSGQSPYMGPARRAQLSLSDLDDDSDEEPLFNGAASTGRLSSSPQDHHSTPEHTFRPLAHTKDQSLEFAIQSDRAIRDIVLGELSS